MKATPVPVVNVVYLVVAPEKPTMGCLCLIGAPSATLKLGVRPPNQNSTLAMQAQ